MALKLSDFLKGSLGLGFGPGVSPVGIGPGFSTRTQNLPNDTGSYQSPVTAPVTAPAPLSNPVPVKTSAPVFSGSKSPVPPTPNHGITGPAPKPDPKNVADAIFKAIGTPDVPAYSATEFGNPNPTSDQAMTTASELNNARNDIATGATDPYNFASKSNIPYTAAELKAIESASAGIYDPAINSALARLDRSQKEEAARQTAKDKSAQMKEQFGYDVALKKTPSGDSNANGLSYTGGFLSQNQNIPQQNTYTIQEGEDPYNIAQNNGTDIQTLQQANPQIGDWRNIQPGTKLNLPVKLSNPTEIAPQDNVNLTRNALSQILAQNGITNSVKNSMIQLANTQGLEGLQAWAYSNRFSNTQQKEYDSNEGIAQKLPAVIDAIDSGKFKTGVFHDLQNRAASIVGVQDPYYNAVQSLFSGAKAEERLRLFGASLTTGEKDSAAEFLPNNSDPSPILKFKVQTMLDMANLANQKSALKALSLQNTPQYKSLITNFLSNQKKQLNDLKQGKATTGNSADNELLSQYGL